MVRNILGFNDSTYYGNGAYETVDFIKHHELNFNRGNAIKYVTRAGKKDPEKERDDLLKAIDYICIELDIKVRIEEAQGYEFQRTEN